MASRLVPLAILVSAAILVSPSHSYPQAPQTPPPAYGFDPESRRVRRSGSASIAVNEACRSCHQPYWAYALPKTEAYRYRLLGTTPTLVCMTASEEPAGLKQGTQVTDPAGRAV
jgi:hypothetical protein